MQKARIKLVSTDIEKINQVCASIQDIADKTGVELSGPIPLPTKKLKITTRKCPCGDGKASWDRFEMRVHKRVIDILSPNPKVIEALTNLNLPSGVNIDVKMM